MLKPLLFLPFVVIIMDSYAQKMPAFKPLRYDEDFSSLKNDTSSNWYKRTKYTALSENSYISFGGDARFQYFNVKNEGWGEVPRDKDGYVYTRMLVHADLHAGKNFRTFVQLQSSTTDGKVVTSPVDEDPLEVHQAFIDLKTAHNKLTFRLGRQEMSYGYQRLVAVREGPNSRQSFDALKSIFVTGNYRVDLFYGHHVASKKGIFDDGFNHNTKFWGAYAVRNKIRFFQNIDLYYLGLWKKSNAYDDGIGRESRHSVGSRIWGNRGGWKYDVEALYQFGKSGTNNIAAWTASLSTSYNLGRVEAGLKTEAITGDNHYADGKLGTFNPLFPRGSYFGLASLIGPANLYDIHPSVTLALNKKLNWNFDYDVFWRYSKNDGLYAISTIMIYSGKDIAARYIGQQSSTDLVYTPTDYLYFRAEFTWFDAGAFLKEAGAGKDIFFCCFTTQIKF